MAGGGRDLFRRLTGGAARASGGVSWGASLCSWGPSWWGRRRGGVGGGGGPPPPPPTPPTGRPSRSRSRIDCGGKAAARKPRGGSEGTVAPLGRACPPPVTRGRRVILPAMSVRSALVLHGPNLNLLGVREPSVYGRVTLAQLDRMIREHARRRGMRVECRQSNVEGQLVDWLQAAHGDS